MCSEWTVVETQFSAKRGCADSSQYFQAGSMASCWVSIFKHRCGKHRDCYRFVQGAPSHHHDRSLGIRSEATVYFATDE